MDDISYLDAINVTLERAAAEYHEAAAAWQAVWNDDPQGDGYQEARYRHSRAKTSLLKVARSTVDD